MGPTSHALSPTELAAVLEAQRGGAPFLVLRDGAGALRIVPVVGDEMAIGRATGNDVVLDWDRSVSRTHVELQRVGAAWVVVDDGLSRNGCTVNGEPLVARRRLMDHDVLRLGTTSVTFRAPAQPDDSTVVEGGLAQLVRLTDAERRVLVALCRPLLQASGAAPASNRAIAAELVISPVSVKTHMRALFTKLDVDTLPQYEKRSTLVRRALESGLVTARDA